MVSIKDPKNFLPFNSNSCYRPDESTPPPPSVSGQLQNAFILDYTVLAWPAQTPETLLIDLFCSYKWLQLYSCFWLARVLLEL